MYAATHKSEAQMYARAKLLHSRRLTVPLALAAALANCVVSERTADEYPCEVFSELVDEGCVICNSFVSRCRLRSRAHKVRREETSRN
jgi:hypothetical protein